MKIIALCRFAWALYILITLLTDSYLLNEPGSSSLTLLNVITTLTFALYCIVMGIQELRGKQLIEAPYFYIFGVLTELVMFAGGLYILFLPADTAGWPFSYFLTWLLVLLWLIIVDTRRIMMGL